MPADARRRGQLLAAAQRARPSRVMRARRPGSVGRTTLLLLRVGRRLVLELARAHPPFLSPAAGYAFICQWTYSGRDESTAEGVL